jgi:hypothetical protein
MATYLRRGCWVVLLVLAVLWTTVAMRAAINGRWASPDALGDVVISFDNAVRFYDNATGDEKDSDASTPLTIDPISVPGSNFGLAFDGALNLLVANTNGTASSIQKLNEQTHARSTLSSQANPRSIVFAGNGDYYVASRTSTTQALIRRFNAVATTCPGGSSPAATCDFTVTVDSTGTCIGLDLDADQTSLNIVDGATGNGVTRLVRRLNGSTGAALSSITLPTDNKAAACAIRTLPPARGSNLTTGGYLVADLDNIKRIDPTGNQVGQAFIAGSASPSDDNWNDVELDPNTFDFWGLNAGELLAARFALASPPNALQSISNLPATPRGLTLNGALRAAQTIRLLNVTPNTTSRTTPSFYTGTVYEHAWQVKPETTDSSATAFLAVQAVDATSNGQSSDVPTSGLEGICPISLDVDCRINGFFSPATAIALSRNRAVFYMVTELQSTGFLPGTTPLLISLFWTATDETSPGPGAPCVPGGPTQPSVAVLRDPFPHTSSATPGYSVFNEDNTILFASGDGGGITRTFNHYIAVRRQNTRYSANLVKPNDSDQTAGSTLQIAVVIKDPQNGCTAVTSGLETVLAFTYVDLGTKTIVADSENVSSGIQTSGQDFVSSSGQWRTNTTLTVPTPFTIGHRYRVCVSAKADPNNDTLPRAIGDVCNNGFTVVKNKK